MFARLFSRCNRCKPSVITVRLGTTILKPDRVIRNKPALHVRRVSFRTKHPKDSGVPPFSSLAAGCKECVTGKYRDSWTNAAKTHVGRSKCTDCERGKYQDQTKQLQCKLCPEDTAHLGSESAESSVTSCETCEAGKDANEERTSCEKLRIRQVQTCYRYELPGLQIVRRGYIALQRRGCRGRPV